MTQPITMKDVYKDLALGFRAMHKQILSEIIILERIYNNKAFSKSIRKDYSQLLKILYQQRDKNASKAEHYRALYNDTPGSKRVITWGKSRA